MAMGSRSTWGVNAVIDTSDAEPAKRVFRVASEEGNNQAFSNKVVDKTPQELHQHDKQTDAERHHEQGQEPLQHKTI